MASYHRDRNGRWVPTSWQELWEQIQHVAAAFRSLGLRKGDHLAILARICREWQLAEMAGLASGAVIVGIDAHAAAEQVAWILQHSGACCLVVDSRDSLARLPADLRDGLRFVVVLDGSRAGTDPGNLSGWGDLAASDGRPFIVEGPLTADHPATLVYTSGTTGTPRGVEYTHGQLVLACQEIVSLFPHLGTADRMICWLPLSSMFQRLMNLSAVTIRSTTYFVEDPREIMERIAEVRPTIFTSVPRFYEKLHDGIQSRLATLKGWRKALVDAALASGAERARVIRSGSRPDPVLRLRHALLDRLVLRRIRRAMGGRVKLLVSGSAPMPVWLLEFFHGLGLLVLEGYALTENAVPVAANLPSAYRFGSVGKPLLTNSIRFVEDGEVLVKGPGLFSGYHREGQPADRFTADGFFRTGDYGCLDTDGFLYLTGRKAELIKTSTGRRVSPALVEGVYRRSRCIDQVVVVGNNRPHLVGLITLNEPAVVTALAAKDLPSPSVGSCSRLPAAHELVRRELETFGQSLAPHEQIRAFAILEEPLGIATGELTTTLKPRRDRIETRYAQLIEILYRDAASDRLSSAPSRSARPGERASR